MFSKKALRVICFLSTILFLGLVFSAAASARSLSVTALDETVLHYKGEPVRIIRIEYGIPHVYADDVEALFFGAGYAVGQDRLWQAELFRRTATGRMAEIFGPGSRGSDIQTRTHDYTDAEYEAIWDGLKPDIQAIFNGYVAGLNYYIAEAEADPFNKIPLEFLANGLTPAPWTRYDVMRGATLFTRRFGETGGNDLNNLQFLQALVAAHGPEAAAAIFEDLRWTNDPAAYATNPYAPSNLPGNSTGFSALKRAEKLGLLAIPGVDQAADAYRRTEENYQQALDEAGFPRGGSNAWVIAPWKSADGTAMLLGGPQMGYSIPQITHEIGLHGAGFEVQGMTFAGVSPFPLIGRGRDFAWTTTTGAADQVDVIIHELNPENPMQYRYQGEWADMEVRYETVYALGVSPVTIPVLRTRYGPVAVHDPAGGYAYAVQRAHWLEELNSILGFLGFNRSRNIQQFAKAVDEIWTSHNFFYVDQRGNIGYWLSGRNPIRPPDTDPRLPRLGDGSQDWLGFEIVSQRTAGVNPPQGYYVNWNNKSVPDWENGCSGPAYGVTHRVGFLADQLKAREKIAWSDMEEINRLASFIYNDAYFFKAFILDAAANFKAAGKTISPQAAEAIEWLKNWDNFRSDSDGDGFYDDPGRTIFDRWFRDIRSAVFNPVLGNNGGTPGVYMLYHLLSGGDLGLEIHHGWLGGVEPDEVVMAALEAAVQSLVDEKGPEMNTWLTRTARTNYSAQGALPAVNHIYMNRGTYNQIVSFGRNSSRSINVNPPGQSGFVKYPGLPSPYAVDQLALYAAFRYKEQVLNPLSPR